MIWLLSILLGVVLSLYLAAPFLASETAAPKSEELNAYREELRAIERSEDPETAQKTIIQARLLKAAKAKAPLTGQQSWGIAAFLCFGVVSASLGLYSVLGSPNFTPEVRQEPPARVENSAPDYAALLTRFEARLADNPEDATGWYLYGRTLMLAGDTEAGLRAYETALELTDTPEIRKEYEAAKTFANQTRRGPSPEDIKAMQNLSPADRAAAIANMVDSLRSRLEADPNDPEGWARLLRSRKVLGEIEAGKVDIENLRRALPNQAEAIIAQSGWTE